MNASILSIIKSRSNDAAWETYKPLLSAFVLVFGFVLVVWIGSNTFSSTPVKGMAPLSSSQARATIAGHTMRYQIDAGEWAEYFSDIDLSGVGMASGSWGIETASSRSEINEHGEVCTVFSGKYTWTVPRKQYCFQIFRNAHGEYFTKVTRNDHKASRIGQVDKTEFVYGDIYSLLDQ